MEDKKRRYTIRWSDLKMGSITIVADSFNINSDGSLQFFQDRKTVDIFAGNTWCHCHLEDESCRMFAETFYARVIRTTDDALLVDIDGEDIWIPKSTLDESTDITEYSEAGDEGEITIPGWLAEDRGLV